MNKNVRHPRAQRAAHETPLRLSESKPEHVQRGLGRRHPQSGSTLQTEATRPPRQTVALPSSSSHTKKIDRYRPADPRRIAAVKNRIEPANLWLAHRDAPHSSLALSSRTAPDATELYP